MWGIRTGTFTDVMMNLCGVRERFQMSLLSLFDCSESLSPLHSEYSLLRSRLIHAHFHSTGVCVCVCEWLSYVRLFETPWTIAHRAPLSMGFSRRDHCGGLLLPAPITHEKDILPTSSYRPAPTWVKREVFGEEVD